jgi:(2Fe-2S) ferredoxin
MGYYQYHVFFCTNKRDDGTICCANFDAQAMRDYTKDKLKKLKITGKGKCRVNNAGCLDRCKEGPVLVVYPEETWYKYANQSDLDEIIEHHIQNGQVVDRLKI